MSKTHSFKYLQHDSQESIFFNKHYEYLKEGFNKTSNRINESKSELTGADSKSSMSVIKHKAMSLLTLVWEFVNKKSRGKNCIE
mmetsp:Transcript_8206/g.7280  ORF Transcript_8206/g.7280 Transcript_8206/m.7280 type:complete len:84 (+) Transcript_8206:181-432(+)